MPIDFHHRSNAETYASREVDDSWLAQMTMLLNGYRPGRVTDIGCGGGIYSRAWQALGAEAVIGIDSSAQMIEDARNATTSDSIEYAVADAYETGLASESCDIVFSRAVFHHLDDHESALTEAFRILKPGGILIVQDRTIEDVQQPATLNHFRAHFFSEFPRLLDEERRRRPVTDDFANVHTQSGFKLDTIESFWETRKAYPDAKSLRADLLTRTGRSILHELTNDELVHLADTIIAASEGRFPLTEHDRWTMWLAHKPKV